MFKNDRLLFLQACNNPFEYCDVVTSTTHKTLRGPRAGVIFYKKTFGQSIDNAVFPSVQGGPHENAIAAIATTMRQAATPEFKEYIDQVLRNSKALAAGLIEKGYELATGGSDNHLVLWSLRKQKITGSKMEKLLEKVNISVNKNTIAGDVSALAPSGVRLGVPAMTSRGLKEEHIQTIVGFLDRAVQIGLEIQVILILIRFLLVFF